MNTLGTVAVIIPVLAVLAVSHAIAWFRGFASGKHVAALDAQIERVEAMKKGKK